MECFAGTKIHNGVAIGRIHFMVDVSSGILRQKIAEVDGEINRFEQGRKTAYQELMHLYEKTKLKVGDLGAQIFEVHALLLEDPEFLSQVRQYIIENQVTAEYALFEVGENLAKQFAQMEDVYFQARSADIKDVTGRVISILSGIDSGNDEENLAQPCILVAKEISPSKLVQMDRNQLLAFATKEGGANSHSAILARAMDIPALYNVSISQEWDGKNAILDGNNGLFIIDPDEKTILEYQRLIALHAEEQQLLLEQRGKETITPQGHKVLLYANASHAKDLSKIFQNDAEGIGLLRSEFLYLEKKDYPTEEEQFEIYKQVLTQMEGKRTIIRTVDVGADKQADYMNLAKEENPALGLRGIRLCLQRPELLKIQLRAILRASAYGSVAIMYPMITSLEEVKEIKNIYTQVKEELMKKGTEIGNVQQGIMIETPAAVMISDLLAKEVDFFSIGTNDLLQYTLAMDRQNVKVERFYNPHHEAIMRMIQMVARNAHEAGIWVGICGELASDISLLPRFMEMEIDELSVAPSKILKVRKAIRENKIKGEK